MTCHYYHQIHHYTDASALHGHVDLLHKLIISYSYTQTSNLHSCSEPNSQCREGAHAAAVLSIMGWLDSCKCLLHVLTPMIHMSDISVLLLENTVQNKLALNNNYPHDTAEQQLQTVSLCRCRDYESYDRWQKADHLIT